MATYSDFTQLNSLADIASASGYGDKKIISVVDSGAIKFYEVGPVDLGAGIEMLDGKFANLKSAGDSATVSFADITGQPSDNAALAADLNSKKSLTTKTTVNTGELPNWAAWIADTSTSALTRPMPTSPSDGEEVTIRDGGNNAETNNITPTVTPPTTIPEGVLNVNGQSKKFRYDASGDTWDLVFSDAPASGGGDTYEVQSKVLYISNGLVSETDTGAKLSSDRREIVDIATHLGSDWVGEHLWIKTQVYNDTGIGVAGWSDPEWIYAAGGYGTSSDDIGVDLVGSQIIVQTGNLAPINSGSPSTGHAFGASIGNPASIKVRIVAIRLTYNNTQGLGNLVDVGIIDLGSLSNNSRVVSDISSELGGDWVGEDILIKPKVQYNAQWGKPSFVYNSGGRGVASNVLNGNIVTQSGSLNVLDGSGRFSGHPFGSITAQTSLPYKAICYKLSQGAVSAGVVGSATIDISTISSNSRVVTQSSSLPLDFQGKTLVSFNEILVSGDNGNPEWAYNSGGYGVRSNDLNGDIVTQSGAVRVLEGTSSFNGSPFGSVTDLSSATSRIKVWRFG